MLLSALSPSVWWSFSFELPYALWEPQFRSHMKMSSLSFFFNSNHHGMLQSLKRSLSISKHCCVNCGQKNTHNSQGCSQQWGIRQRESDAGTAARWFFFFYNCGCCFGSWLVVPLKSCNYHPCGEGHKSGEKRKWSKPSAGLCEFTHDLLMWISLRWMLMTHLDGRQGTAIIYRSKRRGESQPAGLPDPKHFNTPVTWQMTASIHASQ